eukprot:7064919-Pyramimonas_sp.AAC.1
MSQEVLTRFLNRPQTHFQEHFERPASKRHRTFRKPRAHNPDAVAALAEGHQIREHAGSLLQSQPGASHPGHSQFALA